MSESFQDAFYPILRVSQFFGVLPLDFNRDKPKRLKFRWKSVKTIYSLIFLFCGTIESILSFRVAIKGGTISLWGSSGFIFLFVAICGGILMLNLTRKWPELMVRWENCENVFVIDSAYCIQGLSLKRKIWFWASIMGFLAFREFHSENSI